MSASPCRSHSCGRDSYIRAAKKPIDVIYDLPGMAEKMGGRDLTGYSFGPTPANRDSFVKASRKCLDVVYDVPDMVEAMRRDPRGSYAFKAGGEDRMSYITRHMKEVIRREPHNVPGMAEEAALSPKGSSVFRQSGARDSYIRAAKKPIDVIYDLPGMAEKMGGRDLTGYSFGPTPADRDSFVKASRKCLDVVYDVPDMVEAMRRDPRGSYAFKAGGEDRMSYITRHMKEVIRREPHNVPGMADSVKSLPYGTFHACCEHSSVHRSASAPRQRSTSAPSRQSSLTRSSSAIVRSSSAVRTGRLAPRPNDGTKPSKSAVTIASPRRTPPNTAAASPVRAPRSGAPQAAASPVRPRSAADSGFSPPRPILGQHSAQRTIRSEHFVKGGVANSTAPLGGLSALLQGYTRKASSQSLSSVLRGSGLAPHAGGGAAMPTRVAPVPAGGASPAAFRPTNSSVAASLNVSLNPSTASALGSPINSPHRTYAYSEATGVAAVGGNGSYAPSPRGVSVGASELSFSTTGINGNPVYLAGYSSLAPKFTTPAELHTSHNNMSVMSGGGLTDNGHTSFAI